MELKAVSRSIGDHEELEVEWENDIPGFTHHLSTFSATQIEQLGMTERNLDQDLNLQSPWSKDQYPAHGATFVYKSFMQFDTDLYRALCALRAFGLIYVKQVPDQPESVAQIAERIGPLRTTFYGPTWDVRSVIDSKNIAYTNKHLGFHMDLLYMDEPPAYQLLHCIQNSCAGGQSRFVDTYKALDIFATEHPELVEPLAKNEVYFHYDNDGRYYVRQSSILDMRAVSRVRTRFTGVYNQPLFRNLVSINWSPPFMAGLSQRASREQRREFMRAAKAFASILERDDLVHQTKMEEGTCVIFDNRRVVHARNAFDTTEGRRWLRGAYLDRSDFNSRLKTLRQPRM